MALSDGGTIYLMCDGTKVLKMKELFDVADKKERQAKELQVNVKCPFVYRSLPLVDSHMPVALGKDDGERQGRGG